MKMLLTHYKRNILIMEERQHLADKIQAQFRHLSLFLMMKWRIGLGIKIEPCYMLELISLQLESYDTFQGQRKNILAFIPYNNTNNLAVNYDSGNLLFLDLNNRESINLTSLKMRLIRGDYASPDLVGTTSAILYIKDKNEA